LNAAPSGLLGTSAHKHRVAQSRGQNSWLNSEGELVLEVILKSFENPDETRRFEKGKFEIVQIGGMNLGRATYEPGWKWSLHVSPLAGAPLCAIEHVGLVISGRAMAPWRMGAKLS
jgi:hypothetical protein